jgi:hypothetical protein
MVYGVERRNHGVGASVVAFRLFVGACLQCACWKSIAYVCDHIERGGKWWSLGVVAGNRKSHAPLKVNIQRCSTHLIFETPSMLEAALLGWHF